MKKPRLADVAAALAEGLVAAGIASVVIVAVAYVDPGMIGSRRAAIDAVILVGCGVFVSRLMFTRGGFKPRLAKVTEALFQSVAATLVVFAAMLVVIPALFYVFPSRELFREVAVLVAMLVLILTLPGVFVWRLVFTRLGPEWFGAQVNASLGRALRTALVAALFAYVVIMAVRSLLGLSPSGVAVLVFILTFSGVLVWRLVSTRRG